ncbi:zinc-binding alcohol dehydrogenase family protein [Paractinoplanes atraurantiacus]|uniref:Zinc-type alcohol dehydrogenase-like protein n=2 Tax=Paractinoplanes atraurantiacus TaxID=1036182 RepID=A0A285JWW2_9ACTN|nr:zinc-binding alcohol dehydrogenase family protein [Actinoplanes atraurantiacus]
MRAVGYRDNVLEDITLPVPEPGEHDLLVRIEAVSVNPVDVKVRRNGSGVLGFDAAGVVVEVGAAVTLFKPGDQVWYAGSIARPGTNAQFHVVDERIVGPKPASLDFAEAAALPLTALTAWETLFDRLRLTPDSTGSILVLGAAGGVGSILVQLARQLTNLEVIGTASRPESRQYVLDRGAHRVVDHHGDLRRALPDGVDYVFSPHSAGMIETFADIVHPYGEIVAIDEPDGLDLLPLKSKSIAWHWELMFTRALYDPASQAQHDILSQVAALVDKGVLHTTLTRRIEGIDAAGLREAHAIVEAGSAVGKTVVVSRPE